MGWQAMRIRGNFRFYYKHEPVSSLNAVKILNGNLRASVRVTATLNGIVLALISGKSIEVTI
jgi:hypothetical protein